jgi:tetratricopeptide (TPR) repeat protein
MNAVFSWLAELFTSGAILILALYFSAPLFHLIQTSRQRRYYFQRISAGTLNPHGFEARLSLGEIHAGSHRWAKAETELLAAVELNPDHASCRSLLGRVLLRQRKYREAVEQLEKALEIRPEEGYGETHLLIARCYELLGEKEKAIEWYRATIRRNSSMCEPVYRLALLLKDLGRVEESRVELKNTLKTFAPHTRRHYWLNLRFSLMAKVRLMAGG